MNEQTHKNTNKEGPSRKKKKTIQIIISVASLHANKTIKKKTSEKPTLDENDEYNLNHMDQFHHDFVISHFFMIKFGFTNS